MRESPFGRRTDLRASRLGWVKTQGEPAPARRRMSLRYLRRLGRSLQRGMRVREPFTSRDAAEELALSPGSAGRALVQARGAAGVPGARALRHRRVQRAGSPRSADRGGGGPAGAGADSSLRAELPSLPAPSEEKAGVAAREGGFLDHEVFSSRERDTLPLYCEVVRPQGIRSSLVLGPTWRGRALGLIRLQRHGGLPFSRRELRIAAPSCCHHRARPRGPAFGAAPRRAPGSATLTEREEEIAYHVGRGLSTPHIALLSGPRASQCGTRSPGCSTRPGLEPRRAGGVGGAEVDLAPVSHVSGDWYTCTITAASRPA
jgi:hypothetical protein